MPVRKQEAHRALELLEDYHSKLQQTTGITTNGDIGDVTLLRNAIERVINIFKSRLFQALLDIQEYYEHTLLDENKSVGEKTMETLKMVQRWEVLGNDNTLLNNNNQMMIENARGHLQEDGGGGGGDSNVWRKKRGEEMMKVNEDKAMESRFAELQQQQQQQFLQKQAKNEYEKQQMATIEQQEPVTMEKYLEITLEKSPAVGLGFSIAGGIDNPHVDDSTGIYVTKIIPDGTAALEGQLRISDEIIRVNNTSCVNVTHRQAVDALKNAGNYVKLYIRRRQAQEQSLINAAVPPIPEQDAFSTTNVCEIEIVKQHNVGLGFSIAGGIGNQHFPGDNGIYVTKINENGLAAQDGRLQVGDKLLGVGSCGSAGRKKATVNLENVTHEEAVASLKATDTHVLLMIQKPTILTAGPKSPSPLPPLTIATVTPKPLPSPSPIAIAKRETSPQQQQFSTPTTGTIEQRVVHLQKGHSGLGFNIVGGEEDGGDGIDSDCGIFISYVLPGGPADLCGQIQRGDQIIEVNGIDLRKASHEEAAHALKNSPPDNVILKLQHAPHAFSRFESKLTTLQQTLRTSQKRSFYVRALQSFDSTRDDNCPSRGLSFKFGDILHVTNACDDEWWQARRVTMGTEESALGVIPSKKRWERKQKARDRSVKFLGKQQQSNVTETQTLDRVKQRSNNGQQQQAAIGGGGNKNSFTFTRKFPFMKSRDSIDNDDDSPGESSSGAQQQQETTIFTYEPVQQIQIDYKRPVIILGLCKDRLNDDLISEFPERFGSCVPHTTRPRRDYEVDGRDYYFINSREQMEMEITQGQFIEAGQYNENLYGTSLAAVRQVAMEQQKHCILDVSGNAIKRLQLANIWPIAVFIKGGSVDVVLELNRRRAMTDDQAKKLLERLEKIEHEFYEYFTSIIHVNRLETTFEMVYDQIKQVINEQSYEKIWVPTRKEKI